MDRISSVTLLRFIRPVLGMVVLAALMVGCSALSTTISTEPAATVSNEPAILKGVFVDSPVGGINYTTPTRKGMTKADGVFEYQTGETVIFSIGKLVLGSATGKQVVTPLDLVPDAKNSSDPRVVNISVVLQTLDQDDNLDNGILISEQVVAFVSQYGMDINFNKPARAFSFDAGFRNVMAELNNIDAFGAIPRAVKPPFVAQKHLESSLEKLKQQDISGKK
jgi:para-nitrobenzyl esterase